MQGAGGTSHRVAVHDGLVPRSEERLVLEQVKDGELRLKDLHPSAWVLHSAHHKASGHALLLHPGHADANVLAGQRVLDLVRLAVQACALDGHSALQRRTFAAQYSSVEQLHSRSIAQSQCSAESCPSHAQYNAVAVELSRIVVLNLVRLASRTVLHLPYKAACPLGVSEVVAVRACLNPAEKHLT
eukprot:1337443-Pyramimonas_sp.AAC.1